MKYFAYGSNMNFKQMDDRCPDAKFLKKVYLEDYRFIYDKGCDWWRTCGNITESKGDIVWGGLFEISDNDLKNLDEYEQYDKGLYDRKIFELKDEEGELTKAISYFRETEVEAVPCEEYQNIVVQGAKDCGLPEEYISFLASEKVKV
ncbi:MAG: gamma-glutamylcyclotransferase family protein [bacterium]|nr:gamma-glutamylcyclotransferase family protein [bacterium]